MLHLYYYATNYLKFALAARTGNPQVQPAHSTYHTLRIQLFELGPLNCKARHQVGYG